MKEQIATSLFQNKTCTLPGIGVLSLKIRSAESDFIQTAIRAPQQDIVFTPIGNDPIYNEFSAISFLLKNELDQNGILMLDGVGQIKKGSNGELEFTSINIDPAFLPDVRAERVVRTDVEHSILVGDKETNSVVMTEFYSEKLVVKSKWWIWAASLAVISIAAISYYLKKYGFNNWGNISSFTFNW